MRTATGMSLFFLLAACASTGKHAPETTAAAAQPAEARPAPPAESPRLEKARAALDAALASPDLRVRGEALDALGISGRRDALARLSEALGSEHGEVRFAGAQGLAHLRDGRAAPAIVAAFREEKGWAVRAQLAWAAGACGARALAPDLRKALKDPHRDVAVAAAFALRDLGDRAGQAALGRLGNPERKGILKEGVDRWSRKVLGGQKEGDRALAAKTLAEIGTAEDLDLLEPYLTANESAVRIWAAAAVVRLDSLKGP
jgi:HEAT repeat protein